MLPLAILPNPALLGVDGSDNDWIDVVVEQYVCCGVVILKTNKKWMFNQFNHSHVFVWHPLMDVCCFQVFGTSNSFFCVKIALGCMLSCILQDGWSSQKNGLRQNLDQVVRHIQSMSETHGFKGSIGSFVLICVDISHHGSSPNQSFQGSIALGIQGAKEGIKVSIKLESLG